MIYPRDITNKILEDLSRPQALVITGMRRVGKTTILKEVFKAVTSKNKCMLDLASTDVQKDFSNNDFDSILNDLSKHGINPKEKAYIFLDEIQNFPRISQVIKYLHDHYETKFVVTGSSSYYLKNLFPESLAGRKFIYEVFPLTFKEFLTVKNILPNDKETFLDKCKYKSESLHSYRMPYLQEYLAWGGFPQVVLEPNVVKKRQILKETFDAYFDIDVKTLADFKDISNLKKLIELLVARVGNKVQITKLASTIGVSSPTLHSYLYFLQKTYFIHLIKPFTRSVDLSTTASHKLYFCDLGLAQAFGVLTPGQALEQMIYQTLMPKYEKINFYQTNNSEIDFIVTKENYTSTTVQNKIFAIEAKQSPTGQDLYGLKRKAETLKLQEHYIIAQTYTNLDRVIMASDL